MFISFEGIDGCGKSTQLGLLREFLESAGHSSVLATREPGGTPLAEAIRSYLLHASSPLDERAELLLFGAARAQHVREIIRPALADGQIVLSDRFSDSSLAYQGGGLGLDMQFIASLNAFATDNLVPNLTFLLDLSPQIAFERRRSQGNDRIEERGLEFQQRVREAFLELAARETGRFIVLNAAIPVEELHRQIAAVTQQQLNDVKHPDRNG